MSPLCCYRLIQMYLNILIMLFLKLFWKRYVSIFFFGYVFCHYDSLKLDASWSFVAQIKEKMLLYPCIDFFFLHLYLYF